MMVSWSQSGGYVLYCWSKSLANDVMWIDTTFSLACGGLWSGRPVSWLRSLPSSPTYSKHLTSQPSSSHAAIMADLILRLQGVAMETRRSWFDATKEAAAYTWRLRSESSDKDSSHILYQSSPASCISIVISKSTLLLSKYCHQLTVMVWSIRASALLSDTDTDTSQCLVTPRKLA